MDHPGQRTILLLLLEIYNAITLYAVLTFPYPCHRMPPGQIQPMVFWQGGVAGMKRQSVLSMMLVVLAVVGYDVGMGWADQPKSGGTLRIALEADITGLDPIIPGLQNYYVMQNIYNTLVTVDANFEFVPELAESWEVQEQGKVYIFHLRQGVKFHDGTDFDAASVKWNIERIQQEGKAPPHRFFANVAAAEVVDPHRIKITMQYPTSTLLSALSTAGQGLMILSPAAAKKWGKDVSHHPAGTGPFRFVSWQQNRQIVLERNPDYYKSGLPYLDRLEYKVMKEGVTREAALRAGEVDFVNWLPRVSVKRLAKKADIKVLSGPEASHLYTHFNIARKPFDDKRVRQALMGYGIDRVAIAKAATLGYATPTISFVSPGARGYVDLSEMYPYDPDKARSLLKEAGFDTSNPLRYTLMTHSAEPALPDIATIMKTQLAKIGVDVTVEVVDRPIFLKRLTQTRDFEQNVNMALPFIDVGDRGFVIEVGGLNIPNHNDKKVDAMFEKWRSTADPEAQKQYGDEVQRYVADEMLYAAVCGNPIFNAHRADVEGYTYMRGLLVKFEQTWLKRS
jgi:ABC-type transport system substrate-binding protein